MKKSAFALAAFFLAGIAAVYAGTTGWSYTNYNNGSYVPKKGSFTELTTKTSDNKYYYYYSKTSFAFDSTNITSINDYNNGGDNPGTACDNSKAYVTLDMTAKPASWDLEIDAYTITSNLPSPKYDVEDNNYFGENDESEVVAQGALTSGKQYYMQTKWKDYRDGDSGDGGNIQAQFAMSKKGISDYNNCTQSSVVQVINPYGNKIGSL